jgi:hypothetical protein
MGGMGGMYGMQQQQMYGGGGGYGGQGMQGMGGGYGQGGMGGGMGGGQPGTVQVSVPAAEAGRVIGRGGSVINEIRQQSGARVEMGQSDPSNPYRVVTISGTPEQNQMAQYLISMKMAEGQQEGGGGGGGGGGGMPGMQGGQGYGMGGGMQGGPGYGN